MRKISAATMALLATLAGCEPAASPPPKDKVEIKAPGVDIQIEKDKTDTKKDVDVEVKTPEGDVKVNE
jgi:hypothetical protein